MNYQQFVEQLRDLDPENPGVWPIWAHIGAALLLGAAVVIAGYWFLIRPMGEELQVLRGAEPQLRSDFESKQKKVAGLDAYKEQLAEMERSFGAMLKQLPGRSEVENLLNDISQARIASGLTEELFQPRAEVPKEFYAELPNSIVLTGTYHDMGVFVSSVAALPRIVTIDDVDLRPVPNAATGTQLRMTAVAKTYRYLDEKDAGGGKPTAKGKKK